MVFVFFFFSSRRRHTRLQGDWSSDVCSSDLAHRHGVIHRDIKPENILFQDGEAVVADFGIALALSAAAGSRPTETGPSPGTPPYTSPEQAPRGRPIAPPRGLYSLRAGPF